VNLWENEGMNLLLWGLTIGTVGKLVLGIAVLRVHAGIIREHRIDDAVLRALKKERYVTLLGLVLITLGYIMEVIFYVGYTAFFECVGSECLAALGASFSQ